MAIIELTNGVMLGYDSICGAPDTSDVLIDVKTGRFSYTAVKDCFVSANINTYTTSTSYVEVDGVKFMTTEGVKRDDHFSMSFVLKKGQIINFYEAANRNWNDVKIFGLK